MPLFLENPALSIGIIAGYQCNTDSGRGGCLEKEWRIITEKQHSFMFNGTRD